MKFQSSQSRNKAAIATKEKQRLAAYKVAVYDGVFQALSLAVAQKALPPREASIVVKAFMDKHEMAFTSASHGPDSIDAKVRRYFFICKPSLTARRRLFRTLTSFVAEQNWCGQYAVSAFVQDIAEQLHLNSKRGNSSTRDTATKTNSTHARPTFITRPKKDRSPPKWATILDCAPNSSLEIIKQAYRKKVSQLHPDRFQQQGLSEKEIRARYTDFHELQEAYELAMATVKNIT